MNSATAKKLAERVINTGNKGYLIIVFPEDDPHPNPREISFGTNVDNGVLLEVLEIVIQMILGGGYKQEILGQGQVQLEDKE